MFVRLLVLVVSGLFFVDAEPCFAQEKSARELPRRLKHGGQDRDCLVRLPPGFRKAGKHALVLTLHGAGGINTRFDRFTSNTLSAAADKRGVVLVFPQGTRRRWNDGRETDKKVDRKLGYPDDVGFLSAIIDVMTAEFGVDASRVYATGISAGGFMAIRLAYELSDKIVAVAPVAAQITSVYAKKSFVSPVSVMLVNGTADPLVPSRAVV